MSTTANEIEQLLGAADNYLRTGNLSNLDRTIEGLVAVVRELCPLAPKKPVLVANPNVDAWRPYVTQGLGDGLKAVLLRLDRPGVQATASTYVRRSVMKDGGVKVRLFVKVEIKHPFVHGYGFEPRKIIQSHIDDVMTLQGLPKVALSTTCGSQMTFNARVHLQGDEDYDTYMRFR